MNKYLILSRLWATVAKLLVLEPEKFNYRHWVSEFDKRQNCGTVCCVAGWYPAWFPEAGLVWKLREGKLGLLPTTKRFVDDQLVNYHNLDYDVIDCLFYGAELNARKLYIPEVGMAASLEVVINRFKEVTQFIQELPEEELIIYYS